MDYEGTKRNVGPPGHPYGAARVAILERDGGMSSMCRGWASIFPDDYLEIRENRVTHSLIGAHRALVSLFIFTEIRKGGHSFSEGGPPFSVPARLPLCLLSGQSAPVCVGRILPLRRISPAVPLWRKGRTCPHS